MIDDRQPEYVLTIVQHTYCADCMWVKGKITDVYHASGIVRGEDSKRYRQTIWFDFAKAKAEQAHLTAHLQSLHEVLGGTP